MTATIALPAQVLIARAEERFAFQYPPARYPMAAFDGDTWDLRAADATTQERSTMRCVRFTVRGARGRNAPALPTSFTSVVKAWVILESFQPQTASRYANAARYLWEAVEERLRGTAFTIADWSRVHADDFDRAEQIAGGSAAKTINHSQANVAHILKHFAAWLDENEVVPGLGWVPATRKKNLVQHATEQGRQERMDRLPTRRAIEALAHIYRVDPLQARFHEEARSPYIRLMICTVGLLMVTGMRVNELVTLPVDCLESTAHRGRERWYMRYWNEKSQRRAGHWGRRWLSPLGAELAQALIGEIKSLTEAARLQARRLEESVPEGWVDIAGPELPDKVTVQQLADLHGLTKDGLLAVILADLRRGGTRFAFYHPPGKGQKTAMQREDVEQHLLKECGPLVVHHPGGSEAPQRLSETLLIFSRGFLRRKRPRVSPVFVDAMKDADLHRFLDGNTGGNAPTPSVFDHFQLWEDHGGRVKLRPHMPRHWLNTIANKSGMTVLQITLWMQRSDAAQTLYYLHDHADLADLNRAGVEEGTITGAVREQYEQLPEERKALYLEGIQQGHAHRLRDGYCQADTVTGECEVKKICDLCSLHARTAGDSAEQKARRAKRDQFALALEVFAEARSRGINLHPRLEALYQESLEAVEQVLGDGEVPDAA